MGVQGFGQIIKMMKAKKVMIIINALPLFVNYRVTRHHVVWPAFRLSQNTTLGQL